MTMGSTKEILVHGVKKPAISIDIENNNNNNNKSLDSESHHLLQHHLISTPIASSTQNDISVLPRYQGPSRLVNVICSMVMIILLISSGVFLREYIQRILAVVEHQDDAVIFLILVLLYVVVSMPFAWGYILINVATGYLYGIVKGIIVTFVTATIGIFLANYLIKAFLTKYVGRSIISSNSFFESLDLVMSSEQQAFKIVILSRLTPVPFGVQNAIFAMNPSLSTCRYLQATCIGLLPCQVLNVYMGSTFRSMEQLLEDSETAQLGVIVLGCQIAVAVAVTIFVVRRSKVELESSLHQELVKSNSSGPAATQTKDILSQMERGRTL